MENTHYERRPGNGRGNGHGPARGRRTKKYPICPRCLENDEVIPILYGFPTHDAFVKADRGEVYLGGCEITPYSHYCKRDDREF